MAFDQQVGTADIRAQTFDAAIKQLSNRKYIFKTLVNVVPSSAWKNYFFREKQAVLVGQTGNAVKGVPRGTDFPHAVVEWERVQTTIEKYGLEGEIDYEELISNEIDVRNRTLIKIAEGVAKAVDDEIYNVLSESTGGGNIHSFAVTAPWSSSAATIIDDFGRAEQLIAEADYDTSNITIVINPRGKRDLIKYITDKGAQFPSIAEDTATNGRLLRLVNFDIRVSRSVPASRAIVVIPKRSATWKELDPLKTVTIEDQGIKVKIRSWEMGVTQLTDPKSVVLLNSTE